MKKFKRGSISTVTGLKDCSQLGEPKLLGEVYHMWFTWNYNTENCCCFCNCTKLQGLWTCKCKQCQPNSIEIHRQLLQSPKRSCIPFNGLRLLVIRGQPCVAHSNVPVYAAPTFMYILLSKEKPTWCHLFYYIFNTHSMLNMFRPLIRPSSGVCD